MEQPVSEVHPPGPDGDRLEPSPFTSHITGGISNRDWIRALDVDGNVNFIRTLGWMLRMGLPVANDETDQLESADRRIELYAKPDDVWEMNDVAIRCPEIVEGFEAIIQQLKDERTVTEIDDVLLSGYEL